MRINAYAGMSWERGVQTCSLLMYVLNQGLYVSNDYHFNEVESVYLELMRVLHLGLTIGCGLEYAFVATAILCDDD